MDEEADEVEYVAHNRFDERNSNNDAANQVQRSAELFFGLSLLVIGLVLELAGIAPYQRPVPAKQLQNGDFFYNLTNNEQFRGQTVGGESCMCSNVICDNSDTDIYDFH